MPKPSRKSKAAKQNGRRGNEKLQEKRVNDDDDDDDVFEIIIDEEEDMEEVVNGREDIEEEEVKEGENPQEDSDESDDQCEEHCCDDEYIERLRDEIYKHHEVRWEETSSRFGTAWGCGTSRRTFFRNKRKTKDFEDCKQSHSKPLLNFGFTVRNTEETKENTTEDVSLHLTEGIEKLQIREGIEMLLTGEANLCRNISVNKKNKIDKWYYIQALAVLRYLQLVDKNCHKMAASENVASILFNEPNKGSNKSRQIRAWADYYLSHQELMQYRQGQHSKTFTIITDESVQKTLKEWLRKLKCSNNAMDFLYRSKDWRGQRTVHAAYERDGKRDQDNFKGEGKVERGYASTMPILSTKGIS